MTTTDRILATAAVLTIAACTVAAVLHLGGVS